MSEPTGIKKTKGKKRATERKKPIKMERANYKEETVKPQRATGNEETRGLKRARTSEKPIVGERAKLLKKTNTSERSSVGIVTTSRERFTALPTLVDHALSIEKCRVASQVRLAHLAKHNRGDKDTEDLLIKELTLEDWIKTRLKNHIKAHPAYDWFSKVKGIGNENIAKVVGLIDIDRIDTVSSLWAYAGFGVQDGHAPRRQRGEKLRYNSQLRAMCFRLATSLMRAKGNYYSIYLKAREWYEGRFEREGKRIVPATMLPKDSKGKRYESENMISQKHIHMMSLRKMIKGFLCDLAVVWREAEGLPLRPLYAQEYLGHTTIRDPWDMVKK